MKLLKEHGCILYYGITEHNSDQDRLGIDAWFVTPRGKLVIFQIKSSEWRAAEHEAEQPLIPCLNMGLCKSPEEAAVLIQRTFGLRSILDGA